MSKGRPGVFVRSAMAALALAPGAARADPTYVLGVGPMAVGVPHVNREDEWTGGAELSFGYFPDHRTMAVVGGFADVGYNFGGSGGLYSALGIQASYWVFGAELGLDLRTATGAYGLTTGAVLGGFLTFGIAWMGVRASLPISAEPGVFSRELEAHVVFGIKLPVWTIGRFPSPDVSLPNLVNTNQGRPLWVHGVAAQAASHGEVTRDDTRAALARKWRSDALAEHASIAAFARLSLELMALGAPSDLLANAHRAALDEVRHADGCFRIASELAGERLAAGVFAACEALTIRGALVEITLECLRDGCFGEAAAADLAARSSVFAEDPAVKALLAEVAVDEARHAALAWEVVRWSLARSPSAVSLALWNAAVALPTDAPPDACDASDGPTLARYGHLPRETREACFARARAAVIEGLWEHPDVRRAVVAASRGRHAPRPRQTDAIAP